MAFLMVVLPMFLAIVLTYFNADDSVFVIIVPSIMFLILIVFIILMTDTIVSPMKKLLAQVKEIQKGNLDIEVHVTGYHEIESLSKSVERMKNSLLIAFHMLGERDISKDKSEKNSVSVFPLYFMITLPFFLYWISLTLLAGVLYSSSIGADIENTVPYWWILRPILIVAYGFFTSIIVSKLMTRKIGSPIKEMAVIAEKASMHDLDTDFTTDKNLGYLYELSLRLDDLKNAIKRAVEHMEKEDSI